MGFFPSSAISIVKQSNWRSSSTSSHILVSDVRECDDTLENKDADLSLSLPAFLSSIIFSKHEVIKVKVDEESSGEKPRELGKEELEERVWGARKAWVLPR